MSQSFFNFGPLQMVNLPGGWFVMGSSQYQYEAKPHWEFVSPFSITPAPVTEADFCSIRNLSKEASSFVAEIGDYYQSQSNRLLTATQHPMTCVSWVDQGKFNQIVSGAFGRPLSRPREAQWEYAMRGRPVNIRERMEIEGVKLKDFVEWAEERFENFVTKIEQGAKILCQPNDKRMKKILQSKAALWAWQVYGTVNGRLFEKGLKGEIVKKNAWYGERGPREIILPWGSLETLWEREEFINDQIEAGLLHSHGMIDGTGNVWIWCEEKDQENQSYGVLRGGSWNFDYPFSLRLACRYNLDDPDKRNDYIGFRCVAAPQLP